MKEVCAGQNTSLNKGRVLSPAYDINPVPHGIGLHLNIDVQGRGHDRVR